MPACTRERQGDKTLLDICLDVHMTTTGALEGMPPETLAEYVSILREAARNWEPAHIFNLEFDMAVRCLIDATLLEHDRHDEQEAFVRHLESASKTVATWPEWKRKLFG